MSKKRILVTGAGSQLGKSLSLKKLPDFEFDLQSKKTLDITKKKQVKTFFEKHTYDYCLNFAAFTDVNRAEVQPEECLKVNMEGVHNLAQAARKHNFVLVHISTDYVFDGKKNTAYLETDYTNPLNVYGASKLLGEQIIQIYLDKYFIIRTSWLYSAFNRNFVKTILRLSKEQKSLQLIDDQIGTPTYASDLVDFIIHLIHTSEKNPQKDLFGLYHFSNTGEVSWYQFGKQILQLYQIEQNILPVTSEMYKTPAVRPAYSVLSKKKIEDNLAYKPRHWQEALAEFVKQNKNI